MPKMWGIAWPDLWAIGAAGNNSLASGSPAELQAATVTSFGTVKGIKLFRLAFRWPYMQPTLFGALNAAYLERVLYGCRAAAQNGAQVIVDCHQVGAQYNGMNMGNVGLPYSALRDFWSRLTTALKADAVAWSGVWALEIMNEPGQTDGSWLGNHTVTGSGYRAGIQGIRDVDANVRIIVSGEGYTNCSSWGSTPNNNTMVLPDTGCIVAGHQYFDNPSGYSGVYTQPVFATAWAGYSQQAAIDSCLSRFTAWRSFLATKNYQGMVTEFGVPAVNGTGTDWLPLLTQVMAMLDGDSHIIGATTWTSGGSGIGDEASWQYNGSQGIPVPNTPTRQANAHWTVLGNYPTGTVPSPPTPAPAGTGLSIFSEQFDNAFVENGSFGSATGAPATPPTPFAGAVALGITFGAGYGAYLIRKPTAFPSTDYTTLSLSVYSPNARQIGVSLIDSAGNGLWGSKQLASIPANTWTTLNLSTATLAGGVATSLSGVAISEQSGTAQAQMFVDALGWPALASTGVGAAIDPGYGSAATVARPVAAAGAGLAVAVAVGTGAMSVLSRAAGASVADVVAAGAASTTAGGAAGIGLGSAQTVGYGSGVSTLAGNIGQGSLGVGLASLAVLGAATTAVGSAASVGVGAAIGVAVGVAGSLIGSPASGAGLAILPGYGVAVVGAGAVAMAGEGSATDLTAGLGSTVLALAASGMNGQGLALAASTGSATTAQSAASTGGTGTLDAETLAKIDAIKAKTDLIGTGVVMVTAPVAANSHTTVTRGRDYAAADGRALEWSKADGVWPDLTGAAVRLTVSDRTRPRLVANGNVLSPTVPHRVQVELTAAQTMLPAGEYLQIVDATLASGHVAELVRGRFTVLPDMAS